MLFHWISLEAFCHETEDQEKVRSALLNLLPPSLRGTNLQTRSFEGSFGNRIISIKADFEKQSEIRDILDFIGPKLRHFAIDPSPHLTEGNQFWLRFDKQMAYDGEIVLGKDDTIELRGRVAAFPANRKNALKKLRQFLE